MRELIQNEIAKLSPEDKARLETDDAFLLKIAAKIAAQYSLKMAGDPGTAVKSFNKLLDVPLDLVGLSEEQKQAFFFALAAVGVGEARAASMSMEYLFAGGSAQMARFQAAFKEAGSATAFLSRYGIHVELGALKFWGKGLDEMIASGRLRIRGADASGRGVGQQQGREFRIDWLEIFEFDPKQPKHVRGWLKNQRQRVEAGKQAEIRTPPGYEMAHELTKRANEGFDYSNAHLQLKSLNRLEEAVRRLLQKIK